MQSPPAREGPRSGWTLFCGDLVRRWREYRGLDPEAVAVAMNVPVTELRAWEEARTSPSSTELRRLVALLGVAVPVRNTLIAQRNGDDPPERPTPDPDDLGRLRRIADAQPDVPVVVTDRAWNVLAASPAACALMNPSAREPHVPSANLLRLLLDPDGLRDRLASPHAWRARAIEWVRRELLLTEDGDLAALHALLRRLPAGSRPDEHAQPGERAQPSEPAQPGERAEPRVRTDPRRVCDVLDLDVDGTRHRYGVVVETLTAFAVGHYRVITLHPADRA